MELVRSLMEHGRSRDDGGGGPSKKDGKYLDNKCGRVEPCFKVAEKKYPLASLWDGVESSGPAGV